MELHLSSYISNACYFDDFSFTLDQVGKAQCKREHISTVTNEINTNIPGQNK